MSCSSLLNAIRRSCFEALVSSSNMRSFDSLT